MFGARLSELWGASEAIQQYFIFEQKLALALSTEPVFLAREQSAGMRMWVKLSDGSEESLARMATEADVLRSLHHPHVIGLKIDKRDFEVPFIGFPWHAEQPLADMDIDTLPEADRIRIALGLLDVVNYLQSVDSPVAHCRINTENLWLTPTTGWIRLASFGHAVVRASDEDLVGDREQTIKLLSDLLGRGSAAEEVSDRILEDGLAWTESRHSTNEALQEMLRRRFLASVTADLQAIS